LADVGDAREAQPRDVLFEFPPASTGRRPIRFQMRTGFSGQSLKKSIFDL
jgi:hypothetical protein